MHQIKNERGRTIHNIGRIRNEEGEYVPTIDGKLSTIEEVYDILFLHTENPNFHLSEIEEFIEKGMLSFNSIIPKMRLS